MKTTGSLTTKVLNEILPNSKITIIRTGAKATKLKKNSKTLPPTTQPVSTTSASPVAVSNADTKSEEYRENEMNIQMLSKSLFQQIFKQKTSEPLDKLQVNKYLQNLRQHGINPADSTKLPDQHLRLPPLAGNNIEDHFFNIASAQVQPYRALIEDVLFPTNSMPMPTQWELKPGWTHYCTLTGNPQSVPYPSDDALMFDIEVCMKAGNAPTLACALGKGGWYSWVSPILLGDCRMPDGQSSNRQYSPHELIPIESDETQFKSIEKNQNKPKIIIGHNVSYDRARIKEQYWMEGTGTRFLDTMSMHVCVSGVTSYQRAMMKAKREMLEEDLLWSRHSSLNSLVEVYRLYCSGINDGKKLDKDRRNVFVEGTLTEIRNDFQNLMCYCALDVQATHSVLTQLYPMFLERFPHPATLAGMLEIGMAYLPVTGNWNRYIQEANLTYEDLNIEAKFLLEKRANEACRLLHQNAFKRDLWMWDQDWSQQELKFKKQKSKNPKDCSGSGESRIFSKGSADLLSLYEKFLPLLEKRDLLPLRRPLLPSYPAWYRKLCEKNTNHEWVPGPCTIGTGMQVVPKLLSLCWEGYPLHYIKGQGWGFLVPYKSQVDTDDVSIPLLELVKKCPVVEPVAEASHDESEEAFRSLVKTVEMNIGKRDFYRKKKVDKTFGLYKGTGVWCDLELDNCCWFLKLPHKDGGDNRVGNPLAKDFLNKFSENVLSGNGQTAERVIQIARMLSYWRNNRDRIQGQMVVWQPDKQFALGAIIPQVVVCGTLTRRAMEPTWMTASNAQRERVGSELRAMVEAPPGYKFVGADVDSQELWIASVLGDANATKCHGATPFGWMTLNGSKADGSDMHSVTAKAIGISRDHAKVINYARIYGAGQNFAERLLKQFNPMISHGEAKSKAMKMFALTKGRKQYYLQAEYQEEFINKGYSRYEASKLAAATGKQVSEMFYKAKWHGGTESAMFNRLEEIAEMHQPVTPFLQGRLSRPLEPQTDGDDRFLPTRVNWVVQSGAVDFLHLMLVCMRWLMGPNIRFCLSFHDEVRYLVPDEYIYKAALAMHTTNLLTRAFCASRVGLYDLPQSIAFFASVEVDKVLRKEAQADCATPSNPHGLSGGYGIVAGESLTIDQAIRKAGSHDLSEWSWHQQGPESKHI